MEAGQEQAGKPKGVEDAVTGPVGEGVGDRGSDW